MFTVAMLLMRAGNDAPTSRFQEKLRGMNRVMTGLASPSGELPHVGDCDDGRVELLLDDVEQMLSPSISERNALRVSNLLGLGKCLFDEGCGSVEDAKWYGLTHTNRTTPFQAQANAGPGDVVTVFPNSGIGILRHRSAELLFFAIPNGIFGKGSHTHNDKLSFVLRVGGQEVLCDSGTGCYTRDIATRNRFRRTAAHNTLMIDGTEQNRISPGPLGLFILGDEASVSSIQEGREAQGYFLRGSHTGYCSLGVKHTRTARAVTDESAFVIEDELDGDGVHDFELNFQLAPNRNAEIISLENGIMCRVLGDPQVELIVTGSVLLQGEMRPSLVSTAYGATVASSRLRVWGRTTVPARINTQIWWAHAAGIASNQWESARSISSRKAVAHEVSQA
jgi:hypothetical protein